MTYLDCAFELDLGALHEAPVNDVVGWEIPSRFLGMVAIASERVPAIDDGYRAVTYIPKNCVLLREGI